MNNQVKENKLPILLLFLFCFSYRMIYSSLFFKPLEYIKVLPGENQKRAEALIAGKTVSQAQAWSSYYLFPAGFYFLLKSVGLYELPDTVKVKTLVGVKNGISELVYLNIFLSVLSVVFFYQIARKMTGRKLGMLFSILLSVYYPLVLLNSMNISENFYLPALLFLIKIYLEKKRFYAVFTGILLGLCLVMKPLILPLIVFLLWDLLSNSKILNKKIIQGVCLIVPIILITFLVSFVNFSVGNPKNFSISTGSGVNFAMSWCNAKRIKYTSKTSGSFYFAPPVFWKGSGEIILTERPFYDNFFYYKMGILCLRDNPKRLVTNLSHLFNVFNSIFYPNFVHTKFALWQLAFWKATALVLLIFFLAYPFFEKDTKKRRVYKILFLTLLSLFVSVYLANPGEERYLSMYFWALLLGGGAGISLFSRFVPSISNRV